MQGCREGWSINSRPAQSANALIYIYIYIYIYMRWVQVTPGITLKSYTLFKQLDLSRSNG